MGSREDSETKMKSNHLLSSTKMMALFQLLKLVTGVYAVILFCSHLPSIALLLLCGIEAYFYLRYRRLAAEANAVSWIEDRPVVSDEQRGLIRKTILRVMKDRGWSAFQGWFEGPEISREGIYDLLVWGFIQKNPEELKPKDISWVNSFTDEIIKACPELKDLPAKGGSKPRRVSKDPIQTSWIPAIAYIFPFILDCLGTICLYCQGFKHFQAGKLRYWFREDASAENEESMVFYHGIGVGLFGYLGMLQIFPHRKQVLVDFPWINVNFFATYFETKPPTRADFLEAMKIIYGRHEIQKAEMIGQSYGTTQAAWFLLNQPEMVTRLTLFDPICLFMCLPNATETFFSQDKLAGKYKCNDFGNNLQVFLFKRFNFYRRELSLQRQMTRYFWLDAVIVPENLPKDSTVIMFEDDVLLPLNVILHEMGSFRYLHELFLGVYPGGHARMNVPPYPRKAFSDIRERYKMIISGKMSG